MKPSESQLKEFIRKIRTLDKEFIFNKIMEKAAAYETLGGDPNYFKVINVSFLCNKLRKVYILSKQF